MTYCNVFVGSDVGFLGPESKQPPGSAGSGGTRTQPGVTTVKAPSGPITDSDCTRSSEGTQ